MLLEIACLFIFLYQPTKHQAFAQVFGISNSIIDYIALITLTILIFVLF